MYEIREALKGGTSIFLGEGKSILNIKPSMKEVEISKFSSIMVNLQVFLISHFRALADVRTSC